MLGVKQIDEPITQEYFDIITEDYKQIYGESIDTIIKKESIDA